MAKKMTEAEINEAAYKAISEANSTMSNTDNIMSKADEVLSKANPLTDTPKRSRPKPPAAKKTANRTTKRVAKTTAPAINAELVPAPVSGQDINANVRGDVALIETQAMAESLGAIAKQQNTVLVSQANKKLDKQIAIDQGLGLETQLVQEQNATKYESIATQAMKTQQQGARTQLESVRLQGLNIDVAGEAALLPYREEAWQVKALEADIDNQGARALLEPRKEHWALKAELAEVGLRKIQIKIQKDISELEAPIEPLQISQHDYDS